MSDELERLKQVLMRTANNNNTSKKNKQLAMEALDAVRKTQQKLISDDPRDNEEAWSSLEYVFGLSELS